MKAIWNDQVIAESNATVMVEGNHYFPPEALVRVYFQPSDHNTHCPWKGQAQYYTLQAVGKTAVNAAWYYPEPKEAAANIRGHVAFGSGVVVSD
ncbi:NTP_transf_9 domain-containing protein [Pseudomonas marincola]|uniref:DUF427 domain-containing protein n=1 Tax=Pseudomonas marincola TaxID=437900 RepID=A0A653E9U0_9PSED|nr:DUF427 domain-containing protein [Pseudomonas marincola]CAE6927778.1 NTP_transf_9 domain-containing protein [Pseudomonas marincola]